MSTNRITFLDLARGWVIFLVVWVHTVHPSWVTTDFVNTFFFFLSGFFFKKIPFKEFNKKQIQGLLIPFLFFYLISYPFRIVLHYWDYRSLADFDWACIWDIFDCVQRSDYLFVNVPLWFILCVVVMRYYFWALCGLPKSILLTTALFLIMGRDLFHSIPAPFMLNNACYWLGFFIIGNLYGKLLLQYLAEKKHRMPVFLLTAGAGVVCFMMESWVSNPYLLFTLTHVERLLLIVATFAFFSFSYITKNSPPPPQIFWGEFLGGIRLSCAGPDLLGTFRT